jgi:ATP-dependent Clp endopeptidase proteolytic subunit ClpP
MKAENDTAEICLFDEIGAWGVSVSDFKKEFDTIKGAKSITLLINSPGGSVFDGMSLFNILAGVKDKLTVKVLGLAASISSIIALAGKRLIMSDGTYFMIHDPWALAVGTGPEMRKTADLLDSIGSRMTDIYTARSSHTRDEIVSLMAVETWLSAAEAVEAGFADEVVEAEAIAALGDISKFKHAPQALIERAQKNCNPPTTIRELEATLRDAGFSKKEALKIVADVVSDARAGCPDENGSGIEPIQQVIEAKVPEPVNGERIAIEVESILMSFREMRKVA